MKGRIGTCNQLRPGEIQEFNDFIDLIELVDIQKIRNRFTWYNLEGISRSRFDRLLLSKGLLDE